MRVDDFSKIIASVLPFSASRYFSGFGLHVARDLEDLANLVRGVVVDFDEVFVRHCCGLYGVGVGVGERQSLDRLFILPTPHPPSR